MAIIKVTASGNYSVQVTDQYGCSKTSSCFNVTLTGLKRYTANMFGLKPNPAKGNVIVYHPAGLDNGSIEIYDITGRMLLTQSTSGSNSTNVNLTALAEGTYFVKVYENSKAIYRTKLILEK